MPLDDDRSAPPDAVGATLLGSSAADLGPKFDVLETIGRGGMGTVLKVRHKAMDRLRAVKLLHLEDATRDPELVERFRREATIASDLSHPNIVQIHDFDFTPAGEPYIAMEYLEGEDLGRLVAREGRLPLERVVELLSGVADALDRVHGLGVVHRDLKPANLFMIRDGTVKILDFGISHVEWEGPSLTQTGDVLGTPMYMSPEQLRGEKVDSRTDVYALAAVAYELLTGHGPIEATNPAMLVAKILEAAPRRASEWSSDLPDHVADALARGMSKNPQERFATAGELVRALAGPELAPAVERASAALVESRWTSTDRLTVPVGVPKYRRAVIAVVAVLLLAAAVGGVLLLGGDDPEPEPVATAGAVPWPLLVMPAEVDIAGVDDDWLPVAVARMVEAHLSLDARVRLASAEEAASKLGSRFGPVPPEPDPELLAEAARAVGGGAVLGLHLGRVGDGLQLRLDLYDTERGERIWSHRSDGPGFEAAAEAGTWAMVEELLGDEPAPEIPAADRERCGAEGDACRLALMAEEAIVDLGLYERAHRLAAEMAPDPSQAFWSALADGPEKTLSSHLKDVLAEADLPPNPPPAFNEARSDLWRVMATFGGSAAGTPQDFCALMGSRDPLVGPTARLFNENPECEDRDAPYCTAVDTFLDHLYCLSNSTLRDDSPVALRYYEEFAETDLASKLITATFSMLPMNRDVELARRWVDRARLRHQGDDASIANAMVRIELARRNPTEALVWARRSLNPEWREGAAHLLDGRFHDGIDKHVRAMNLMVGAFGEPPDYLRDVLVRAAIQPMVVTGNGTLARWWIDQIGEAPANDMLAATVRLAELIRGDRDEGCRDLDVSPEAFGLERLFHCGRWQELLETARLWREQGYGERASRFLLAEANLQLKRVSAAEQGFASVERDPVIRLINPVATLLALERLGRLAEQRGDTETARERYAELVRLWDETDVPIPEVEAARAGLTRLGE